MFEQFKLSLAAVSSPLSQSKVQNGGLRRVGGGGQHKKEKKQRL